METPNNNTKPTKQAGRRSIALLRWLLAGGVASLAAYVWIIQPWFVRWGAVDSEVTMTLPGDDLVPDPAQWSTRAITIGATPEQIWPWLVQIGQGRAGLYSYDWLENLVGCDIHSTDKILSEYQTLKVGDPVRMGPKGYPLFVVRQIQPNQTLVLSGANPKSGVVPDLVAPLPADYLYGMWSFNLFPVDGQTTRLIVRNKQSYNPSVGNAAIWRITEALEFLMEQKLLRGIKARVESTL